MSIIHKLLDTVRQKPVTEVLWDIIGIIAAIGFGLIGLYSVFHEARPNISFEIVNEANVLDIHKPLKNLIIYFQGEDIQQRDLNLRILTVRIENTGEVDILPSHFDQNIVWGIEVKNGKIIDEVRLVSSNSEYLNVNLCPKVLAENTMEFKKLIFEKGKYFTFEILVLHKKEKFPEIVPIGKIAGIEKIMPINFGSKKEKTSFDDFFHGSVPINLLRFVVLAVAGSLIAYFVFEIYAIHYFYRVTGIKKAMRREKEIKQVLKIAPGDNKNKVLESLYVSGGLEKLEALRDLLENRVRISSKIERYKEYQSKEAQLDDIRKDLHDLGKGMDLLLVSLPSPSWQELVKVGVLTIGKDSEISVDPEFEGNLKKLIKYFEFKNLGKTSS